MATDLACPVCGEGRLHLDQSGTNAKIDGVDYKVPFRTHWCDACGSKVGLNGDLRFNARAMRHIRKQHAGMLTGAEVRACRKRLGLNQEQAARLFGGGPVAFSKYENDEVMQSEAMDRLIWIVSKFPALMIPLAQRVKMDLGGSANIVIKMTASKSIEEYFSDDTASIGFADEMLHGFGEFSTASNDSVYQPREGSRPAAWKVA